MKTKNAKSEESLWKWNNSILPKKRSNNEEPLFPVTEFVRKAKDSMLGPGAGAGIGCGVGVGFGVVGGYGFGGAQWNQLNLVLGVGFGCGLGLGFGLGQGFGYGYSAESLGSYLESEPSLESKKEGGFISL